MKKFVLFSTTLLAVSATVFTAPSYAGSITDLYNTGVDNAGVALGPLAPDPHYTLTTFPFGTIKPIVTTPNLNAALYGWVPNTSTSRWIGPLPLAVGPRGSYTYKTTFTLPSFSTALITGQWATDNNGLDILINGISTGFTTGSTNYGFLTPFSISSGFIEGINTLEFKLSNSRISATGLRVANLSGAYTEPITPVPEPANNMALLALGLLSLGAIAKTRIVNKR